MAVNSERYEKAIRQNLAELNNAILKRRALIGLHSIDSAHGLDFFRLAAHALYNDIISHTVKVFEDSSDVASFWYIVKTNEAAIKIALKTTNASLDKIEELSKVFKHIRDKVHFHIDKEAILNPSEVWVTADITGDELGFLLETSFNILSALNKELTGELIELPDYDGKDAAEIIRCYAKHNPNSNIAII